VSAVILVANAWTQLSPLDGTLSGQSPIGGEPERKEQNDAWSYAFFSYITHGVSVAGCDNSENRGGTTASHPPGV